MGVLPDQWVLGPKRIRKRSLCRLLVNATRYFASKGLPQWQSNIQMASNSFRMSFYGQVNFEGLSLSKSERYMHTTFSSGEERMGETQRQ